MRIGIDIDGVLTDEGSFLRDYGSKFCYDNHFKYHLNPSIYDSKETLGITDVQYKKFWNKNLEFYATHISMRPFASQVLNILKERGNHFYIITARSYTTENSERGEKMRNLVKEWLHKHHIPYDEIYFSTQKEKICNELKIDYMIEDQPQNIMNIAKVTKVICYHDLCNENIIGPNIIRCYSWYDILAFFENV